MCVLGCGFCCEIELAVLACSTLAKLPCVRVQVRTVLVSSTNHRVIDIPIFGQKVRECTMRNKEYLIKLVRLAK